MSAKARLLIVEDERIVASDLAYELRDLGYAVAAMVATGEDAILKAAELRPDLVLMDIHLAGEMDGIAAAETIIEREDVPVVYVTAYADEETLARARITKPYGYVIKPVDTRELEIVVEISLQQHQTLRRVSEAEATMRGQADQLAEALSALRQLDSLKGQFVRNVSHELRTPLALVLGYAEMLASGNLGALTAEQQTAVNVMARRASELHLMIEDMTLLLEAEDALPDPELVDLSMVLDKVAAVYDSKSRLAGLAFASELEPQMPKVLANPVQLYRVFSHLLSNAVKFTPAGGSVALKGYRRNGHVEIEVIDTGLGIAQEEHNRIFQRFYQVDGSPTRTYPGMGLGLAVVKETVEALGGDVTVASTPGCGSSFRVRLPAH